MIGRPPRGMISETDPRVAQIGHPAPPWLINYADLMTELVIFFVVLYALSAVMTPEAQEMPKKVEEAVEDSGFTGKTEVTQEGIKVTLQEKGEKAIFASGQARLNPEARVVIARLVPAFRDTPYDLLIEGHTDNVPIGSSWSQYPTNWELSTARATTVVRYLIDHHAFPPDRIAAIGYGEHRPIAPNDTEANRAKNRRVVFFMKILAAKFIPGSEESSPEETPEEPSP